MMRLAKQCPESWSALPTVQACSLCVMRCVVGRELRLTLQTLSPHPWGALLLRAVFVSITATVEAAAEGLLHRRSRRAVAPAVAPPCAAWLGLTARQGPSRRRVVVDLVADGDPAGALRERAPRRPALWSGSSQVELSVLGEGARKVASCLAKATKTRCASAERPEATSGSPRSGERPDWPPCASAGASGPPPPRTAPASAMASKVQKIMTQPIVRRHPLRLRLVPVRARRRGG